MIIRKAERKKIKLRLGISGAPNSGKTRSALEIARGIGGKIGLIDSEHGRGELYAGMFDYDVIRLEAPFTPESYINAILAFEREGYDVLIIDSMSHAWNGKGGILEEVDQSKDKFTSGWKTATPKQNALIDTIMSSKMHIIATFRAKTEYVIEKNEYGKNQPRKIGLAPIQRPEIEYEFMLFMTMNQDHFAQISKDNTRMFDENTLIQPNREMGEKLLEWLNEGSDEPVVVKRDLLSIVEEINECVDLVSLENVFKSLYTEFPDMRNQIIRSKDMKKEALINGSIIQPNEIGHTYGGRLL
ncbi:MAG: AAA family ATPase [Candidatus Gracilibacteria bacterium]|jgi:hypothetical protein